MGTPSERLNLSGVLEAPPSPTRPRQRRPSGVERPAAPGGLDLSGVIESAPANPRRSRPASAAAPAPRNPHSADDYLLDGDWSPERGEAVKSWFKQTYGRDLPHRFGQTSTHDRMGLDHSQNMDVQLSPQSDEGRALAAYLRENRIPFLAYNTAKPGAATGPHFHVGRPSRGLGSQSALNLDGVVEPLSLDGVLEPNIAADFRDGPASGDDYGPPEQMPESIAFRDDRAQAQNRGDLPQQTPAPLRPRETYDPTTEEGRRGRDSRARLERTPGAFLEVSVPLPAQEKLSDVATGSEMVRIGYVNALVARGVPKSEALKLVGSDYSLQNAKGEGVAPADIISDDNTDYAARMMRVKLDAAHLSKLADSYRASGTNIGRAYAWATDAERSPGEKALDVALPVVQKGARAADLATRPLQAIDAGFWSKLHGVDNVDALKVAYDQFFGDNPELGRNVIAGALKHSERLHSINPRLPALLGELANLVLQPSNLIPVGAVAKGGKLLRAGGEAGRVGRLLEGVGDAARGVGALDRGMVEARPLGLVDDALEAGAGRTLAAETAPAGQAALEGLGYGGEGVDAPNPARQSGPPSGGYAAERVAESRADLARLSAYHVHNGAQDFDAFAAAMVDDLGEGIRPHLRELYDGARARAVSAGETGAVGHLFDAPEPAPRTAATVAEDIRVTHARERADYYSREAARAKDPVHRAEAERLAAEYADEAAEARVSDVAQRVKSGAEVAPEEMADLERAVIAEDGAPTYIEVNVAPAAAASAPAPRGARSPLRRAFDAGLDAFDATKSMFAALDLSAAGRQAFVPFLFDTRATLKGLKEGLPSALPRSHVEFARWLDAQPDAKMWRDLGLDLDTLAGSGTHNEFFTSHLAEKIPGYGPAVIKPSDRVMTAQLDAVRLHNARSWDESLRAMGATPETHPDDYRAVAKLINAASGRAELGRVGQAIHPVTRRVIFSPKLLKSRFQILNPLTYAKLPPAARSVAARRLGGAAAKMAGILGLAYLTADEVGLNPFKGDFMHARYGNTTYDLSGGLASKFRLPFQLIYSVGATANAYRKGEAVEYKDTPWGIGGHFLRSQLAPSYSLPVDAISGETFDHKPFTWTRGVLTRVTPGFSQDVYDGWVEGSGPLDVAKTFPSFLGISTRTRNQDELKREWAAAREASKRARAVERTADVLKDAPAEVRDELRRLRVYLPESDAGLAAPLAEAVARAQAGPGWAGMKDGERKKLLENILAGVRKEAGAASAQRAGSASRAKEAERVQLTGTAAEEVGRLGVVVDPVFAGHKVGVSSGESVGFKGEHSGQTPEQLDEYRRRLAEETQAEVERVMSFEGYAGKPDAVKRSALQAAADRVKTRLRGAFHFDARRREHSERERLEDYQRELEGRSRPLKSGETLKLGDDAPLTGRRISERGLAEYARRKGVSVADAMKEAETRGVEVYQDGQK